MISKPKNIVILTGLFCSVMAGGTSHFYSFFRKYFGKGWTLVWQHWPMAWQANPRPKTINGVQRVCAQMVVILHTDSMVTTLLFQDWLLTQI